MKISDLFEGSAANSFKAKVYSALQSAVVSNQIGLNLLEPSLIPYNYSRSHIGLMSNDARIAVREYGDTAFNAFKTLKLYKGSKDNDLEMLTKVNTLTQQKLAKIAERVPEFNRKLRAEAEKLPEILNTLDSDAFKVDISIHKFNEICMKALYHGTLRYDRAPFGAFPPDEFYNLEYILLTIVKKNESN